MTNNFKAAKQKGQEYEALIAAIQVKNRVPKQILNRALGALAECQDLIETAEKREYYSDANGAW